MLPDSPDVRLSQVARQADLGLFCREKESEKDFKKLEGSRDQWEGEMWVVSLLGSQLTSFLLALNKYYRTNVNRVSIAVQYTVTSYFQFISMWSFGWQSTAGKYITDDRDAGVECLPLSKP